MSNKANLNEPEQISTCAVTSRRRLAGSIEKFYSKSLNVDLAEALAAGLMAGMVLTFLRLIADMKLSVYQALITVALPTLCLYIVAALLLDRFWRGDLRRFMPCWFLLPVLGSALAVTLYSIPGIIAGWSDPFTDKSNVAAYVISRAKLTLAPFILINLLTWPITFVIHHFGPAVKWMRT